MAKEFSSFRMSKEFVELLDKIKAKTGATKVFIVEKAVREYYKDIIDKEEK